VKTKFQEFLLGAADIYKFSRKVLKSLFSSPPEIRETAKQFYNVGNRSLFLITFTAFLVGIVFTKQSRPSLSSFGAESWLPSLVSQAVVRSLGPLITGLICAGKLGSNIGAELGSMKVTEQIDAMEVSGTRPFSFLVVSRIAATTMALPLLVVYADVMALFGSFLTVSILNNTGFTLYFNDVAAHVTYTDVFSSLIKSVFFGFAIGMVGSYAGYNAENGTTGVGKAANTGVVISMLIIFIIDLLSVQVTGLFR
jgi:phospholipid/cholesterol/gamma-HCH transport system permease protein